MNAAPRAAARRRPRSKGPCAAPSLARPCFAARVHSQATVKLRRLSPVLLVAVAKTTRLNSADLPAARGVSRIDTRIYIRICLPRPNRARVEAAADVHLNLHLLHIRPRASSSTMMKMIIPVQTRGEQTYASVPCRRRARRRQPTANRWHRLPPPSTFRVRRSTSPSARTIVRRTTCRRSWPRCIGEKMRCWNRRRVPAKLFVCCAVRWRGSAVGRPNCAVPV